MFESENNQSKYVNANETNQTLQLCKMRSFPFINAKKVSYIFSWINDVMIHFNYVNDYNHKC